VMFLHCFTGNNVALQRLPTLSCGVCGGRSTDSQPTSQRDEEVLYDLHLVLFLILAFCSQSLLCSCCYLKTSELDSPTVTSNCFCSSNHIIIIIFQRTVDACLHGV
jgi:hypothetical protein